MSGITEREASSCAALDVLQRLDVPVVVAGLDGLIRDRNQAAAELSGIEREELEGQRLASGLLAGTGLGTWIVDRVLERGSWQGRIECPSGSEGAMVYEVRATELAGAYGETAAVAVAFLHGAPVSSPPRIPRRRLPRRVRGCGG